MREDRGIHGFYEEGRFRALRIGHIGNDIGRGRTLWRGWGGYFIFLLILNE
jgi:hypothetical protein